MPKTKQNPQPSEVASDHSVTRFEIKELAKAFAHKWEGKDGIKPEKEESHKQTWWNELFAVYGVPRTVVATFEDSVKNSKGNAGSIDLFYPKVCVVEHKSRGCSNQEFQKALQQAIEYVQSLAREGRSHDAPRYLVISDFERIRVYDLKKSGASETFADFKTIDLAKNIDALLFLAGGEAAKPRSEQSIDIKAVELLGGLHDALEAGGYKGHNLERFLVRCLFCLFADDIGIFQDHDFEDIVTTSREDANDLGALLANAFRVLDTEQVEGRREPQQGPLFANLPYVNGELFKEDLGFTNFTLAMRHALLQCCAFDWSAISPAVFGSLFQCVMEPKERRQVGAHYTSEADIMKVIRSLFLDELEDDLDKCGTSKTALQAFHDKITTLKFLDPACGCGNFLICAYKELRRLEYECLERLAPHAKAKDKKLHGISVDPTLLRVLPSQFYGIEIGEWAGRIAEVAMILTEQQEDEKIRHGLSFTRLPLKNGIKIHIGNALQVDWNTVLPPDKCSYILGNPPFCGGKLQTSSQRADMAKAASGVKNFGLLDYVTGWYFKAADYIRGTSIRCAFVSTNSVSQGEQVGVLWGNLLSRGIQIHFAHRTFAWESEARGRAHVHVVIVGFGCGDHQPKLIYEYDTDGNELSPILAKHISPYLTDGNDVILTNRHKPLCAVPEAGVGNKPIDGGNYLFTTEEREAFIASEPKAAAYFRKFMGADEFISNKPRWCLWLGDASPSELKSMPKVLERIEAVRRFRAASKSPPTQKLAKTPTRFHVEFIPSAPYLLIPLHTSERRAYIPIGYLPADTFTSNSCLAIANASAYHFGILTSAMHMAWVRQICGRLESRYRYSARLVYNNYPFPQEITDAQRQAVETAANGVFDARDRFMEQTLADLYDPNTMPPELVKAHDALDQAVDRCYRKEPFTSERERVEFLFALYEKLEYPATASGVLVADAAKTKRRSKK